MLNFTQPLQIAPDIHGRSKGQTFTEANMLITSPVRYVVKSILWKPNILPLFNLGW